MCALVRCSEPEVQVSDGAGAVRETLLATIVQLLTGRAGRYADAGERSLLNDVLGRLLEQSTGEAKRRTAYALADLDWLDGALARRMAHEEIAIARPILQRSGALQDADLVDVLWHRGREHQLAVASRRNLSPQVCEVIAAGHDGEVIAVMLENRNARIAVGTFEYLIDEARRFERLQRPLAARDDLPAALAERLLGLFEAPARAELLRRFPKLAGDRPAAPTTQASATEAAPDAPADAMVAEAWDASEAVALRILSNGHATAFTAWLSLRSGLTTQEVRRLLYEGSVDGLCRACAQAGLSPAAFAEVHRQFALAKVLPGGRQELSRSEVAATLELYRRVLARRMRKPA